jgi:hypothetical protein
VQNVLPAKAKVKMFCRLIGYFNNNVASGQNISRGIEERCSQFNSHKPPGSVKRVTEYFA